MTITVRNDTGRCIGFVSYRKFPMVPWYAIHSLYIYPELRNKGYGTTLVKYVCELLKQQKSPRAYIQPGPFELDDSETILVGEVYKQKMYRLIEFYKKLGFKPANKMTSFFAAIVYFFVGIQENSRYLMMNKL